MPYTIRFEEVPPLFRLTLTGFWGPQTLQRFVLDVSGAMAKIFETHAQFDTLVDASDFAVQGTDIVEGFGRMHAGIGGTNAGRSAILIDSALARLQAKRTVVDKTTRVFGNEADALAWLSSAPA